MRDLEIALVDHVLVEEQDVEIDDARSPPLPLDPLAPHRLLDGLELLQQRLRGEVGLDLDDAVDEPRLGVAQRLALVERRRPHDPRARQLRHLLDGFDRVGPAIAEVRSDADVHAVRHPQGAAPPVMPQPCAVYLRGRISWAFSLSSGEGATIEGVLTDSWAFYKPRWPRRALPADQNSAW